MLDWGRKEIFHLYETGALGKLPKTKQGVNSKPNCAGNNFKGIKHLDTYSVEGSMYLIAKVHA